MQKIKIRLNTAYRALPVKSVDVNVLCESLETRFNDITFDIIAEPMCVNSPFAIGERTNMVFCRFDSDEYFEIALAIYDAINATE